MNEHTHIDQSQVDQHILDLLNGSIDGELSAAEHAELDKLLAGSVDVRDLYEELKELAGILDGQPEQEPPEYLHSAITSQVRLPLPVDGQRQKPGFLSDWLSTPWMRTGLAVAAGVIITIGIYQSGPENLSSEDVSSMTGSIVKNPNGELLDSTRFNTKAINGKAELRYKDGLLFVDVNLESAGKVVVNLNFSGQGLEYAGINGLQNKADDVAVANGSVSVASSGQQHYALLLKRTAEFAEDNPGPLMLEFFADDILVYETQLGGPQ